MKRLHIMVIAAVVFAALALPGLAYAKDLTMSTNHLVTFTSAGKMTTSYSGKPVDTQKGFEPGDTISFTVNLKHEHATTCKWFMANDVLKTLEEERVAGSKQTIPAKGSLYGYKLTYKKKGGNERVIYSSDAVGGENSSTGLHEATTQLKDWFYLDSLKKGDTATVTVEVTFDGETETNSYFDTVAELMMKFRVEMPDSTSTNTPATRGSDRNAVATGDDTDLFPFYVAMTVSGLLLLLLGIYSLRSRKREKGQHEAA